MNHHIKDVPHTDIHADTLVFRICPKTWHPYIKLGRYDRPIGGWLLLFPAWWGLAIASNGLLNLTLEVFQFMGLFFIGAFIIRGAGCTINDMWDRNIDALVERTKTRPLASGELTLKQAYGFLFVELLIALLILLQLNLFVILIGGLTFIPIVIYPLMKRVTFWPQLFLGLTFNLSALIGWATIRGSLDMPAIFLYLGCVLWTVGYDTIYAHQDIKDDLKIGVKSTAVKLAKNTKLWLSLFYGLSYLGLLTSVLVSRDFSRVFTLHILSIIPAFHLYWQIKNLDINTPSNCLATFKSNKWYGWLVLLTLGL